MAIAPVSGTPCAMALATAICAMPRTAPIETSNCPASSGTIAASAATAMTDSFAATLRRLAAVRKVSEVAGSTANTISSTPRNATSA